MSLYKRERSPIFYYDFKCQGRRFSGPTGCTARRQAEAFEKIKKAEAREQMKAEAVARHAPMTIDVAAGRYFEEVGKHRSDFKNVDWSMAWLVREIGPETMIADIDDMLVARIVAKRRGEVRQHGRKIPVTKITRRIKPRKPPQLVSPSTVNRSVTEPLRQVLRRARLVWKQQIQEIYWRTHLLSEPEERVRELSVEEEARLFSTLRPAYHPVVRFTLLMGLRLSEVCNLTWDRVDWGALTIRVTGKGKKTASLPMSAEVRDILWSLRTGHERYVFTSAPGRPVTPRGLASGMARAIERAKIFDFRPFHDYRHTAATRMLRATGNIRVVQKLMRHSDIATTARYAHVVDDDVREGLTAVGRASELHRAAALEAAAAEADWRAIDGALQGLKKGPTESPTEGAADPETLNKSKA